MESRATILSQAATVLAESDAGDIVPDYIIDHLSQIFECLSDSRKGFEDCAGSAHAIAQWYIDQGFREVSLHVAISDVALEIIKILDSH